MSAGAAGCALIPGQQTWPSLGLRLQTAALPQALTQQLQERWATADLVANFPLEVKLGKVVPPPTLTGREISVSNAVTTVWSGLNEVWLNEVWIGGLHLELSNEGAVITAHLSHTREVDWLLALAEVHRVAGWLPLHAATVARGPEAVSICGISGAGKSTAALRLMGQGLQVLAEDQTWINLATRQQTPRVTGLDRVLRAFPASFERFAPQLLSQAGHKDSQGKLTLALQQAAQVASLRAVLLFGLPTRAPLPLAVKALWEAAGVPLTPLARQVTAQGVSRLISAAQLCGTDREKVIGQVEGYLRPHPSAATRLRPSD